FIGGIVPFGFTLEGAERRGSKVKNKLIIEPAEAHVVRLMFDLYLRGHGIKAITTKLNADGILTRSGKPWYRGQIGRMLSSEVYIGKHLFRPTDWRTKKRLHRSEWIEVPCPSIIDDLTFSNVQRLLRERNPKVTAPRDTNSDGLLSKIARCGACGASLMSYNGTGRNKVLNYYYGC